MRTTRRQLLRGLLATGGTAVLGACSADPNDQPPPRRLRSFYWGVGIENTSMVQADPTRDGTRRPLDELKLTQHYSKWQSDLGLAVNLGAQALRYGVPWYRLEPEPGTYDLSWLAGPIDFARQDRRIVLVLDLFHYGTPAWMQNGIADERMPQALAALATRIAHEFPGRLTHVTPCNEPQLLASASGATGTWPPYGSSLTSWVGLGVSIARAMVLATEALRSAIPNVRIVSADPLVWTLSDVVWSDLPPEQREALRLPGASFPACLAYGTVSPDDLFGQFLLAQGAARDELEWFVSHAAPPDVVGYNHYPDVADFSANGDFTLRGTIPLDEAAQRATQPVEIGLRRAHAWLERPVWLAETSAGLSAEARAAYARALGDLVHRLRTEGFPLVGLNWWPLYKAAQWSYRDSPELPVAAFLRSGGWNNALYDLELGANGQLARVETAAASAYRDVIMRDTL